ncbi:MAG: hypothetical protein PWQ55_2574 [Chloroflexota bacterium]|nr:hypothetical protein [Chloroflexota bacterium]
MNEPSILDYLKSLLRGERFDLQAYFGGQPDGAEPVETAAQEATETGGERIRWQVLLGAVLAILGQVFLEPAHRQILPAFALYLAGGIFLWLGFRRGTLNEFDKTNVPATKAFSSDMRLLYFGISMLLLVAAFLLFTGNTFTLLNVAVWLASILFFVLSVWEKEERLQRRPQKAAFILSFVLVLGVAAFYRYFRLNQVPGEMWSDHAEKLLDVLDVLNGKTSIFFTRNTGREAFQFYLTAAIIKLFHTDISFLSLKLGMVTCGLVTLPFIYLLAKELTNKWVGLLAMLLAGMAYWPNVISRVALRYALYPLFTAPMMFYLFRGLKRRSRNDLIVSGLLLGLALQGYSPARILPIYVVVVFLIYWLHTRPQKEHWNDVWVLGLLAFSAFIVFLPLFRYFLENPELVSYRALTRLTSVEHTVEGSTLLVFLNNLWKSLVMFFYDNGQIWVHSIPHRPALDMVTAGFFFVGLIYQVKKYLARRQWEDLALLVAIPVLMLPSILSLAFPDENPSLNRSGGAIVPVFLIAAIGVYQCAKGLFNKAEPWLSRAVLAVFLLLSLACGAYQNYDLVFNQYAEEFMAGAWNTSEIGAVIRDFIAQGNPPENAHVVPYPYWVDTRLVGINAGQPDMDYALWAEDFDGTLGTPGNQLFILKPEDSASLQALKKLYPQGDESVFYSKTAGKNFIIYSVSQSG